MSMNNSSIYIHGFSAMDFNDKSSQADLSLVFLNSELRNMES